MVMGTLIAAKTGELTKRNKSAPIKMNARFKRASCFPDGLIDGKYVWPDGWPNSASSAFRTLNCFKVRSPATVTLFLAKAAPILAAATYSHNMNDGCKLLITNDSYRLSNIGRLHGFRLPVRWRTAKPYRKFNPLCGGQNQ